MRERAYTFGDDTRLVGIVSQPEAGRGETELPAVLLLNAGLLHRVGPARLSVDLGRRLSTAGFVCLRFDLSGLGDSDTRRDQRSEPERALADIQQSMGFLGGTFGLKRFVVIGLCSGADNAHLATVSDERVVGTVLFDPYGYRTTGYYIRHYGPRLFQLSPWIRFARRTLQAQLRALSRAANKGEEAQELFERHFPPRAQVASELQQLVQRGVDQLLVYSGGVREHYYNHSRQFREMFPQLDDGGHLEVEYYGDADHVYTLRSDRERLIERVCGWMSAHYPSQAS